MTEIWSHVQVIACLPLQFYSRLALTLYSASATPGRRTAAIINIHQVYQVFVSLGTVQRRQRGRKGWGGGANRGFHLKASSYHGSYRKTFSLNERDPVSWCPAIRVRKRMHPLPPREPRVRSSCRCMAFWRKNLSRHDAPRGCAASTFRLG